MHYVHVGTGLVILMTDTEAAVPVGYISRDVSFGA